MAKMTTEEKLAQAKRLVAQYEAELAQERIRDNIQTGDTVTFDHGRGNTRATLTGTVLGMKDDSNGRWVKVQIGEGFDADTKTIRTAAITANPDAEKRVAEAEQATPAE